MWEKLKSSLYRISRSGSQGLGSFAASRVVLINCVCLFLIGLALFFMFVWSVKGVYSMAISNVVLACIQGFLIWLNSRRYHTLASFLIIFFVHTPLFVGMGMGGREYNIQYTLIPMAAFSVLLFDLEERWKIAVAVAYPVVLLTILEIYDYKIFPNLIGPPPSNIVWFTYAMNLATILVLTLYLFRANTNAQVKYQFLFEEHLKAQKAIDEERARSIHSAKMVAIGEMAGGIVHEIISPLGRINITADLLYRELTSGALSNEKGLELTTGIQQTTKNMFKIVRSLSAMARSSGPRPPIVKASISSIIDDTLTICSHRFYLKNIELKVPVIEPTAEIFCRPIEVGQVLLNLLNNAFDAVAHLPKGIVQLEVISSTDRVLINVMDNGKGVSEEARDKIFDAFFTTKEAGMGMGLGLSISKKLMEDNQGKLYLDGSGGQTKFVMEFSFR